MRRITTLITFLIAIAFIGFEACSSGGSDKGGDSDSKKKAKKEKKKEKKEEVPESIKKGKGIGPVEEVEVADKINEDWAKKGEAIHGKKCASCHKLTDKRATGPGWAGITNKRKPEWIMNMIMDTEAMLAQDPEAQKQLAECATRMPNQNLSRDEARQVLEFMRKNDMDKVGKKDQAMESS
jgi:mono/diheme cytochrome c family protein